MRIFIPTLNRGPDRQYTIRELGPKLVKKYNATLVAPHDERKALESAGFNVLCPPNKVRGIAATRQFILDNSDDPHVLMLDDDLSSWSWRYEYEGIDRPVQYKKATDTQRAGGLKDVAKYLKRYGHGSIGHRLFANARAGLDFNTRQLRALAYDRDALKAAGVRFRVPVMEDFDVQLQMLKKGHECFQYNWLVQEQRGSNVDGGCSTYRTHQVQEAAARELARLHPGIVTVVERKLKVGWGNGMGDTRVDVKVNWRRAIQAGMAYKHAQKEKARGRS